MRLLIINIVEVKQDRVTVSGKMKYMMFFKGNGFGLESGINNCG